jgi:hypothetical protein
MATFVLVHGAWHGGWCYKRVATRLLRQAGHEVCTPTLTGLGEHARLLNRAIDLDTHVQDIVGVIRCEELSDVVLCGRAHRRRLGRRAHGAWWPPESGRDRIAFSTHNAHEGPEARN